MVSFLVKPSASSISLGPTSATTPSGEVIGVGIKGDGCKADGVADTEGREGVEEEGGNGKRLKRKKAVFVG